MIQWWNRNTNFQPILQSRLVLYLLFFFSVVTLFGFALNGEFLFAIIFIIVGFLTSFFSKNMIVILFLALAVTNIIIQGLRGGGQQEGLATKSDEDTTEALETLTKSSESETTTTMDDLVKATTKKDNNNKRPSEAQAKKDIQNLLDLQLKLMTGVNSIQPIMKEVQGAIQDLRNKTFQ